MSLTCDTCGSLLRSPARVWTRGAGALLWCDPCRGYEGGAGDDWRELDGAEVQRRAYELEQAEAEPVTSEFRQQLNGEIRESMHAMGLQTGYKSAEPPRVEQKKSFEITSKVRKVQAARLAPTAEEQRQARWLAMTPAEREQEVLKEQNKLRRQQGMEEQVKERIKAAWTPERRAEAAERVRQRNHERGLRNAAARLWGEQPPAKQRAEVERIAPRQAAGSVEGLAETLRRLETLAELDAEGRALLLWALGLEGDDRDALIAHVEGTS